MTPEIGALGRVARVHAPAKINLFLHVRGKRDDNFHELESLIVFADLGDRLEFTAASSVHLEVAGPFAHDLAQETDNLVLRAARTLHGENWGAAIKLEKNLPIASGVGGGSADAAATLRGLNNLWTLNKSEAELCSLAETLGSDVPACVLSRPLLMRGRGEVLDPLPAFPSLPLLLVNPRVAVSTRQVFGALKGFDERRAPMPSCVTGARDLAAYLEHTRNDLRDAAVGLAPVIGDVLHAIEAQSGCAFAQMSGSGATCFGLFENDAACVTAAQTITKAQPGWWVEPTRTQGV